MAKILLVEDDKALREIYGVRLLAEGYDIVSAGDGEEALTMAINEIPDLIVSDVMMPKISGFEMLDLLRTNDKTKGIKVIMMTALGGDQQRQRGEKLGADRYLVKSQVGIEDVVATVHEVLADRSNAAQPQPASPNLASIPTPTPAQPAPNQSPFNPPAATLPSTTVGVPAPILPPTPPTVPTITAPPLAPQSAPPPTQPVPSITPVNTTPLPPPATSTPAPLPPIAPPIDNVPSFQPVEPNEDGEPIAASTLPAPTDFNPEPNSPMPNTTTGSTSGVRVIQPTGESLTPVVDINTLLANEDSATDTATFPAQQ